MKITITTGEDEDGNETVLSIPARYEVCDRCRGTWSHTNPAIDGNGITGDEMDELGPEFLEDYLGGVYDVQCEECRGERLVLVPDDDRCSPEQLKAYHAHLREEWEYRALVAAERRVGA